MFEKSLFLLIASEMCKYIYIAV